MTLLLGCNQATHKVPPAPPRETTGSQDAGMKSAVDDMRPTSFVVQPYAGPAEIANPPTVVTFDAVEDGRKCVVLSNGAMRCWPGYYPSFKGYIDVPVPYLVGDVLLTGTVKDVHMYGVTCAIVDDGKVICMGAANAAVGNGDTGSVGIDSKPSDAPFLALNAKATQLAVGSHHACALLEDGALRCWGGGRVAGEPAAYLGQLGYGTTVSGDYVTANLGKNVPVGGPVKAIVAAADHTCALLMTGKVRCWGKGPATGSAKDTYNTPEDIGDLQINGTVIQIATASTHSCALIEGGRVVCWGDNAHGQLGWGNKTPKGTTEMGAGSGNLIDTDVGAPVKQLALNIQNTCALLENGHVRCWGARGTIGMPTIAADIGDDETPAQFDRDVPLGGDAKLIAGSCVLLVDGSLRCWGENAGYKVDVTTRISVVGDNETPAEAGPVPLLYPIPH